MAHTPTRVVPDIETSSCPICGTHYGGTMTQHQEPDSWTREYSFLRCDVCGNDDPHADGSQYLVLTDESGRAYGFKRRLCTDDWGATDYSGPAISDYERLTLGDI